MTIQFFDEHDVLPGLEAGGQLLLRKRHTRMEEVDPEVCVLALHRLAHVLLNEKFTSIRSLNIQKH